MEKHESFRTKKEEESGLKTRVWWQRRGTGWYEEPNLTGIGRKKEENEEGRRMKTRKRTRNRMGREREENREENE